MKKIFNNQILIKSDVDTIKNFVLNANLWMKWNPALSTVRVLEPGVYAIHRNEVAINQDEIIRIDQNLDQVVLTSTGGRLEYKLTLELVESDKSTLVKETVSLLDNQEVYLPIKLLAPVAKAAFYRNLQGLKQLVELTYMTKL